MKTILLLVIACNLCTCAALSEYNSHVAAREDSLSGYTKNGGGGGAFTHRVEYR